MSVIAWDGRHIACDRAGLMGDIIGVMPKCRALPNEGGRTVVAWCGIAERGIWLANWYAEGADPAKWPEWQSDRDFTILVVAQPSGVVHFEKLPVPQPLASHFGAWGAGREVAIGALAMGATARMAVDIACQHVYSCGRGIDVFQIR